MFKGQLIIEDMTGGINSKQRSTKIKDNQFVSIVGFDFDGNSLRRAKGYTKFGTESDVNLTGKTLYTHQILAGQDVLVKPIGTYIKFYDDYSDSWLKMTDDTFTANKRWSFVSFNGFMYGGNGNDNFIFWNGSARSSLANSITTGSTEIDLGTGHGGRFPSSGSLMIEDDVITYTGRSGDQLTGVSNISSNHAAGVTVILKLDSTTYSSLETPAEGKNTMVFFQNRNYYISADNKTKILHSKLADNTNPETDIVNFTVAGSGSGDAGFGFAPDELVGMRRFINSNSTAVLAVFCKNGEVYAFVVTDSSSTTSNAFIPIRTMNSYPISPSMICVAENDLAIVDQFGHVRTLTYGDQNTPMTVRTISEFIEPSLEATYWDNGAIIYHNRELIAGGASIDGGTNDIYYIRDADYEAWKSYGHWDVVDFAEYNAELYGLSAVTGNVFKLNNTYAVYTDDVEENYEGEYYSEIVTKAFTFERPHYYKETLKMRADGFITSNTEAFFDIYTENGYFTTFKIDGTNQNILFQIPNIAVGTVVFGQGVFGGGLPNGSVRREFFVQLQLNVQLKFLKFYIRIRMTGKNVDFELTNLSIFAKLLGEDYWLKEKIIKPS